MFKSDVIVVNSIRRDIDNSDLELSTKTLFKNPNNDTKKKLITTIITLFADIVLPVVLYFVLKKYVSYYIHATIST